MNLDDYLNAVLKHFMCGNQRRGQALMNALFDVRPDLYRDIVGTDADPFYTSDYKYFTSATIKKFFERLPLTPEQIQELRIYF